MVAKIYLYSMEDQQIRDGVFAELVGEDTEFEGCSFTNIDFGSADLGGRVFMDCQFKDCNLSNIGLKGTAFREVGFEGCKMMGLVWGDCQPFFAAPEFVHCQLQYNSFVQVKLPGLSFRNCDLSDTDFTGADLSGSVFEDTEMARTIFEQTDLRKSDLRSARNFLIDPHRNKLQKMRISLEGAPGILAYLGLIVT